MCVHDGKNIHLIISNIQIKKLLLSTPGNLHLFFREVSLWYATYRKTSGHVDGTEFGP